MKIGNLYDYMEREKDLDAFELFDLWNAAYNARRGKKYETTRRNTANVCKQCGFKITRKGETFGIR